MTLTCQSMSMMNECDGLYTFIWTNFPNVSNKEKKEKGEMVHMAWFPFFFFFFLYWNELFQAGNIFGSPEKRRLIFRPGLFLFSIWTLGLHCQSPLTLLATHKFQIPQWYPFTKFSVQAHTYPVHSCVCIFNHAQFFYDPHWLWPSRLLCLWNSFRQEY